MLQHVNAFAAATLDMPKITMIDETDPNRNYRYGLLGSALADAAIKADLLVIVCCRRTRSQRRNNLSRKPIADKSDEAGLRNAGSLQISESHRSLQRSHRETKKSKFLDYDLQFLLKSARFFAAHRLAQLDAYAASLDEKFIDKY
jgi:hypothetical protein